MATAPTDAVAGATDSMPARFWNPPMSLTVVEAAPLEARIVSLCEMCHVAVESSSRVGELKGAVLRNVSHIIPSHNLHLTARDPKFSVASQASGWGLPGLGTALHLWHFRAPGFGVGFVAGFGVVVGFVAGFGVVVGGPLHLSELQRQIET